MSGVIVEVFPRGRGWYVLKLQHGQHARVRVGHAVVSQTTFVYCIWFSRQTAIFSPYIAIFCVVWIVLLYIMHLLTYPTVQSPSWAANWFAASQEIPRISRNPKVHYRTYNRPPPVSILGQPNPVHIPTSHLLEIHPNIQGVTGGTDQTSGGCSLC